MILVELWLWAVFFRFSGEYRALPPNKQIKLGDEAFRRSLQDYREVHKHRLLQMIRELTPRYGLNTVNVVNTGFVQTIRPTFEHFAVAAQRLPPLHEQFDLAIFRTVLSEVNISFLERIARASKAAERDRQYNLKLLTQVAAVGQAQLYAMLTGMLIPANIVLVEPDQIPDLIDVFISYARADALIVSDLAAKFEKCEIVAWYDERIHPDAQFDRVIADQVAAAVVVLTVWTVNSTGSKWVRAESLAGFNADKLLQLRVGACDIPPPFNIGQAIEFEGMAIPSDKFEALAETIQRKMRVLREHR